MGNVIGTVRRCSLRSFLEGKNDLKLHCLPFHVNEVIETR